MKVLQKICRDCGTIYGFIASGYHINREVNNETWCPECMENINIVRNQIVRKFEYRWIPTDEFNYESFEALYQKEQIRIQSEHFPTYKNFYPILYKLGDMEDKNIKKDLKFNNTLYLIDYWTKNPEEAQISKKVYWDILNNKIADEQPRIFSQEFKVGPYCAEFNKKNV